MRLEAADEVTTVVVGEYRQLCELVIAHRRAGGERRVGERDGERVRAHKVGDRRGLL